MILNSTISERSDFMKILAVIDMQNDFIDGSLGTAEAVKIVDSVSKKIEKYRALGVEIIFTRDTHPQNYLSTNEGKRLPVEHCIKDSYGWQICKKLDIDDSKIINKPTFGSYELAEYISQKSNVDEVELIGLCTDICVISNAILLKAKMPEIKIIVDSSCCAGVTVKSHENALDAMKMCQIDII